MKFTKQNIKSYRADLEKALNEVGKKHGIRLSVGTIRFDEDEARCKLIARADFTGKDIDDFDQLDFELNAKRFGVPADAFGKFIKISGREYKIVGIRPNARKNAFIIQGARGGRYIATANQINAGLGH